MILMTIISGLLVTLGVIGCVMPVIPGPVLSFAGLLCLLATDRPPSMTALVVMGGLTAVATVLDYVVPAMGARKFRCSAWGVWGCVVGTAIGLFFFPLGLLLGPFLGALVGELIAGKALAQAVRGGVGAFLGFVAGTLIKLAVCIGMLVWYVMHIGDFLT